MASITDPSLFLYSNSYSLKENSRIFFLIVALYATVILLELITSADYVFSYFYIGPILLANFRLNRKISARLTLFASIMIIVNLWIPGSHIITIPTIANRVIAVCALVVTDLLSYRNRYYEQAIAQQQTKLHFQEQLASFREDFVSTLTHDLRTPLLGALETLKAFQQCRFGAVTAVQQKVLDTMACSHQSSLQLIETLLDVYRNDADGVKLERSPVELTALVEQVIDTLSNLAANYQVSINVTHAAHPCWIHADSLQVQRVVSNLLMNAVTHSPIDGKIEIVLETQTVSPNSQENTPDSPHLCVVKVLDEGPGVQTEELVRLFERFYQGNSERQAKGAGLGLYLCRQIVEAHGGKIWAENRIPHGAAFAFYMPIYST